MKQATLFLMILICSCGQRNNDNSTLGARIDSLQRKIDKTYKPGLGEFMSGIQVHHEKLWFAGRAQNWKLADFEIGEIKEAFDGIREFCADRPEVRSVSMIEPALDSVMLAIQKRDTLHFRNSFIVLTNTCNSCHVATKHEFNVIKIPDTPPFSNQVFKQ